MKRNLIFVGLFVVFAGARLECFRIDGGEEDQIRSILEHSPYTPLSLPDDSADAPVKTVGYQPAWPLSDPEPFVMFARAIDHLSTDTTIVVTGDSATVIIAGTYQGTFWVDNNPHPGPYIRRPIDDRFWHQVRFFKGEKGWEIASLTPVVIAAVDPEPPVLIKKVQARVAKRNYTFTLTDPLHPLTKSDLPHFQPGDTVNLTVEASVFSDSSWAFFHHRDPWNHLSPNHRDRLQKTNTVTFTGTYIVASNALDSIPTVFHNTFDAIAWQSLFGRDADAPYSSACWILPCIIKRQNDSNPPDVP